MFSVVLSFGYTKPHWVNWKKEAAALVCGSVGLYVVLSPLELSLPLSVIHSIEGGEHRLQIITESNLT